MSEFGDKSAATVKDSASRSALEASNKLSELFMEVASKQGNEQAFSAEMEEKLKDVLPSLSIVSFQNDKLIKYDTDGDGAVSDKEMDAAIKSDKTSQKDKLMLTHLAKQYEVLKNQNQEDGRDGGNAIGITNKDVEAYLNNNPTDKALVVNGSTTRNFGTWQETVHPDGTIVKRSGDKVFQYVPQGDYSKFSNIETKETGKITVNGKEVALANGDSATMDEKGAVTIKHADTTSEVHHANGTVEKKNAENQTIEIIGNGVHAKLDPKNGRWYVPGDPKAIPPTKDMYLPEGKKAEVKADGSIELDFGDWKQKNLPDGTIIKTKGDKVFQYVPHGDWSKITNIEDEAKGEITVNGEKIKVDPADEVSMSENGTVFVVREGRYTDEYRPDGTVIKKDGANIVEVKIPGQIEAKWNGTEWVDKDGKPTNIKHVEVDAQGNIKVIHKDDSYNIYHADGSYEIYDEKGNKKCDVDAATAKATNDKKSELQELSKIESGKGPYDAAKKMLEAAGVSPLTHKVILEFARWLRDKVAQKTSFKTGEQLVDDDNWQKVADKINEIKAAQKK